MHFDQRETTTDNEQAENVRMLRDSAASLLGNDLARVRKLRFEPSGFDKAVWREMCGLGWLGLRIAETRGGVGFGMQEYCALAEELGTALAPEPLIFGAVAARCLPDELMPKVLAGERIVLPVWQEEQSIGAGATQTMTLHGRKLNGEIRSVMYAKGAHSFLVATGSGVALVDATAAGLTMDVEPTQDGGHCGHIRFDNVEAMPLPAADFESAVTEGTLAMSGYLLGVAQRAFRITADYMKIRRQFGVPIGSFQALQHRLVDLYLELSLMRASMESAAVTIDSGGAHLTKLSAVSRAKARASRGALRVCREAIQLHGAIGYTDEADIGLFMRKTMTFVNAFGSERKHRTRFLELTKMANA